MATAVAYFRTSSATNVGEDKHSEIRQREAVERYAKAHNLTIVAEFYDAAVSGADPIDQRPGFVELLRRIEGNGVRTVLVEEAGRFARDLAVQLAGEGLLKGMGVELIPVNAPDYFREDTPTAVMVRQILGAVAQFEKAQLVSRLRVARDRKRAETGRCGGPQAVPEAVVAEARRLSRKSPKTGQRRSLRAIAAELAKLGHLGPSGKPYGAESIKRMLAQRRNAPTNS